MEVVVVEIVSWFLGSEEKESVEQMETMELRRRSCSSSAGVALFWVLLEIVVVLVVVAIFAVAVTLGDGVEQTQPSLIEVIKSEDVVSGGVRAKFSSESDDGLDLRPTFSSARATNEARLSPLLLPGVIKKEKICILFKSFLIRKLFVHFL